MRDHDDIQALIDSFADDEPPAASLGTPFITDTDSTRAVVARTAEAVPPLLRALASANSKIAMYAAYCLGLIGDNSVVDDLRRARERYLAKEPKGAYDFGVVSAANQALERLGRGQTR